MQKIQMNTWMQKEKCQKQTNKSNVNHNNTAETDSWSVWLNYLKLSEIKNK